VSNGNFHVIIAKSATDQFLVNAFVMSFPFHGKVKVKVTLVQTLTLFTGRKAHRGSRGIALLFHDQRH